MAEPTVQELQKQLEDLNKKLKEAGGLGIDLQEAFRLAGNDTKKLNEYAAQLNKQYEDLVDNADYVYRTFQDISAELKNQNLLLKIGKSSFKGFTDIAQDLNSYQKGYNDLTDIKFKKLKNNLGLEKKELEFVVARLKAGEKSRIEEAYRLNNALKNNELEGKQKTLAENRLKELQKENELLINAEGALKSGIPVLEKELDLTKQIADTRKDLGGLSQAAGKLISQYGGSLASFLNINEAIESVEEYNKQTVQAALSTKEVKDQLLNTEIKRKKVEEDYRNGLLTEIEYLKKIKEQEDESYAIKQKAIASTNNLGNKFSSLGVFVKELGVGFKKSLLDPVTILTFLISKALTANAQVVQLGKSLGNSSEEYRENLVKIESTSNNLNVTTKNLVAAFDELVTATGYVSKFSADALETQIMLTKQFGLTGEEAAGIFKFSQLTGKSSKAVNDAMVGAFVATRNSLKVGVPFKAAIAEAAKVSGALASSFQNNPGRIAAAVVQAKALGTSLEQTAKQGESLLNFESSIENELKAELLTGKQLNLERARAAALAGDQVTLAEELVKNVGSIEEFDRMNVLQKKALAEAVGLTTDELAKQLQNQKLAQESGKSLAQITKEQALEEQKRQDVQTKFNAAVEKLQSLFGNLMAGPLGSFLDMLSGGLNIINKMITPLKIIGGLYLAHVATKKIAAGYDLAAFTLKGQQMGQEVFLNRQKVVGNLADKKGLLTKTAYNIQLFTQLAKEQGIIGALTTQLGLNQASNNEKNKGLLISAKDWLYEKGKTIWQAIQKTGLVAINALKTAGSIITKKDALFSIAGAAMGALKAAVSGVGSLLGPFAIPIGIAAAAGVAALGYNLLKGDDVMSEGGYGKRTLLSPEGAIKLNDKDTVIAGTDLGGGTPSVGGPSIDLTPMISAINEVKAAVDNLINRPVVLNIDGKQLGSSMVQGSYKVA
jgi:hypothetical protein